MKINVTVITSGECNDRHSQNVMTVTHFSPFSNFQKNLKVVDCITISCLTEDLKCLEKITGFHRAT